MKLAIFPLMLGMRRLFVKTILCLSLFVLSGRALSISGVYHNVKDFGAVGDGVTQDTRAIQAAVDSAASQGGGTVVFPPGAYSTETVVLKDRVTLLIDAGVTILGSTEMTAFKPEYGSFRDSHGRKFGTSLFFAREAQHVGIRGHGTIDGQGYADFYPNREDVARPSIIRFIGCRDVRIEDITLINAAAWVQHYVACDDVLIRGVKVKSYSNKNNDGLDIESCQRVIISQCNIDSEDDSIVLKALSTRPCRDVVICDCVLAGLKSAIKTGTESAGGFENISISNCVFYGTRGLTFYTVDGGHIDGVTVSNITMRDTYGVICLRLGDRMRPYALNEEERPTSPGTMRNLAFSNIQASGVTESNCFIAGIPDHCIENVTLDNVRIEYLGGGLRANSERKIPELSGEYPKPRMFGMLPASGLFLRHARNVTLEDVHLSYIEPDHRSVIVAEDVAGLRIDGLRSGSTRNAAPFLALRDVRDAFVRDCRPLDDIDTFLHVSGAATRNLYLTQNDMSLADQEIVLGEGVGKRAIRQGVND